MGIFAPGYHLPGQPTRSSFIANAPRFANSARPPGVGANLAGTGQPFPNSALWDHARVGGGFGSLNYHGIPDFSSLTAGDMRRPSAGGPLLASLPARAESSYAQHPVISLMQRIGSMNPGQRQQFGEWVSALQRRAPLVSQYAQGIPMAFSGQAPGPGSALGPMPTPARATMHPAAQALVSALTRRF